MTNGMVICTASNISPQLCSDDNGGAIITWENKRSGTNYDIYAQRVNSTGNVTWMANSIVLCKGTWDKCRPSVCSDGQGGAIIAWYDNRNASKMGYDIYTQRIDLTGNISWAYNGIAICKVSRDQTRPQLCSDGQGSVIIAWQDYRSHQYTIDIYAQCVNSTGTFKWFTFEEEVQSIEGKKGSNVSAVKINEETATPAPDIILGTILLVGGIIGVTVAISCIVYLLRKKPSQVQEKIVRKNDFELIARQIHNTIFRNEQNIEIKGTILPIKKSSKSGLRYIDYLNYRFIEQNPVKNSYWAKLAKQGHKITLILKDGKYIARILDGNIEKIEHKDFE